MRANLNDLIRQQGARQRSDPNPIPLPFGGVNGSGMGSYHGYWGFKEFSHHRAVYQHMAA